MSTDTQSQHRGRNLAYQYVLNRQNYAVIPRVTLSPDRLLFSSGSTAYQLLLPAVEASSALLLPQQKLRPGSLHRITLGIRQTQFMV